jgi:hypothetical protein
LCEPELSERDCPLDTDPPRHVASRFPWDEAPSASGQAIFIFASFRGFCLLTNREGLTCVNICKRAANMGRQGTKDSLGKGEALALRLRDARQADFLPMLANLTHNVERERERASAIVKRHDRG